MAINFVTTDGIGGDKTTFYATWPSTGKALAFGFDEIRQNQRLLAGLMNSTLLEEDTSEQLQDAALTAVEFGEVGFHNKYRVVWTKANSELSIQKNEGTELVPVWASHMTLSTSSTLGKILTNVKGLVSRISTVNSRTPSDGRFYTVSEVRFNQGDGFYLTSDADGNPIVNLSQLFGKAQRFDQTVLQTEWQIGHNFGSKNLIGNPFTDGGEAILGARSKIRKENFVQSTVALEWQINHSFGERVNVQAFDDSDKLLQTRDLQRVDTSNLNTAFFYINAANYPNGIQGSVDVTAALSQDIPGVNRIDMSDPNTAFFYFSEAKKGYAIIYSGGQGAVAVLTKQAYKDGKVTINSTELNVNSLNFYFSTDAGDAPVLNPIYAPIYADGRQNFEEQQLFQGLDGAGEGARASKPTISFADYPDLGSYVHSANQMGFAAGGAVKAIIQSSGLRVIDGSAATPSVAFLNDGDNGLFRPGTNTVGITAGGTERIRVDGTGGGAIGINTTSPKYPLHVQGDVFVENSMVLAAGFYVQGGGEVLQEEGDTLTLSPDGDLAIISSGEPGNEGGPDFTITRNSTSPANNDTIGRVLYHGRNSAAADVRYVTLVGTASVVSAGTEAGTLTIQIRDADVLQNAFTVGPGGSTIIRDADTGAAAGPVLSLNRDSSSPATNDVIGQLRFMGEDDGSNNRGYADINASITDVAAATHSGALRFFTAVNAVQTHTMRMQNGRVIIGTSQKAPESKLHVEGDGFFENGKVRAAGFYLDGGQGGSIVGITTAEAQIIALGPGGVVKFEETRKLNFNRADGFYLHSENDGEVTVNWTGAGPQGPPGPAASDHNALINVAGSNDDHTQYLLISGTRAMTGGLEVQGDGIFTNGKLMAAGFYLDDGSGGGGELITSTGVVDYVKPQAFAKGTSALPGITFVGDTDSGFSCPFANQVDVNVDGSQVAQFSTSGIRVIAGSAGAPSYNFLGHTDHGMFVSGGNSLDFAVNGATVFLARSGVGVRTVAGTESGPSHSFIGATSATGTGMWLTDSSTGLAFSTNQLERVHITQGGNVGIGTKTPVSRLDVRGGIITSEGFYTTGGNDLAIDSSSAFIEFPTDKTYTLEESAAYAYDVNSVTARTTLGEIQVGFYILKAENAGRSGGGGLGTSITGLDPISFSASQRRVHPTSSFRVSQGDRLVLSAFYLDDNVQDFSLTLNTTRLV